LRRCAWPTAAGRPTPRPPGVGLVVAISVMLLAGCTSAGPPASPDPTAVTSTAPETIGTPNQPLQTDSPVPVPDAGAYVGAWVAPTQAQYTAQDRIAAVDAFEEQLHRPLDIVHTYRKWDDPTFSDAELEFIRDGNILLYSWAGTDTRTIASGQQDVVIRQRADDIRQMGRPILLEWRWEMDRPNLRPEVWSPEDYVAAWKHIREIFDQEGVTNAAWVWCPTSDGFANGSAPQFYPGDSEVDWVCVDAYPDDPGQSMVELLRPFLQWAAGHPKPIIVGEYGVPRSIDGEQRAIWLRAAADMFRANPQIKAASYFDGDPAQHKPAREWSFTDDPIAMQAFAEMADDPYFNPDKRHGSF
jgi:hypothetical protein